MPDLRQPIQSALQAFSSQSLKIAALSLLDILGYRSDRTLVLEGSQPQAFLDLIASQGGQTKFDPTKALFADWTSADILFQLTDADISRELILFKDTTVQPSLLQSYLFFAIELKGKDYPRGALTAIARQLNRVFPMPVMLLIRHGDSTSAPALSIAVINRRRNKLHAEKDVLEKVTLIRDISLSQPHRGHLDILASFALGNLVHPKRLPIQDFDTLHAAWEQIFNVELLNARFYKELSNWYFWALPQVDFPADLEPDSEKRRATGLIRLLTRLVFCWFLKEKDGLIPEKLFHPADLAKILNGFDPESETSSTYYQAILQNLFFATLNQRMGKDAKGQPHRFFATDEGFQKNRATHDVNNLYRYEKLFAVPQEQALALFADIPFLNGGLFECLDRTDDTTQAKRYLDGFSRDPKKRPTVPDRLFFDGGETADLSAAYGDKKRKAEKVTGLIHILNRYKFTIVENTPIDQEIALDPELLGKVFENLLASYNEETKTTARKQTGSFYTPRPIVDYMVDESLKAHLERKLEESRAKPQSHEEEVSDSSTLCVSAPLRDTRLSQLFTYTEEPHQFSEPEVATLIAAIDALKILDPACGSGAFPMGVLHKLVYILTKLDPDNDRWKATQLAKLDSAPMRDELERAFADNNDDYGRKLYLIENCLYGVDIQPIAIQITKLRFFISLVCDQKTNRSKKDNHGIRPLPNLETKFVAADTLIGLPEMQQSLLVDPRVGLIEKEIEALYHSHFSEQRRDRKLANQRKVKALRQDLGKLLAESLMSPAKSKHVAEWDPFDPQACADFFDPHWMFGQSLTNGFDIVIANPPYVEFKKLKAEFKRIYEPIYTTAKGKYDIYVLFIERAVRLLGVRGIICFINPTTFLKKNFGEATRVLIAKLLVPKCIVDFGDIQMFDGPINYTGVFVLAKGNDSNASTFPYHKYRKNNDGVRLDYDSAVVSLAANYTNEFKDVVTVPLEGLGGGCWDFQTESKQAILDDIKEVGTELRQFTDHIFQGIASGKDEVFYVNSDIAKQHDIESDMLKPLLKGRDLKRYCITWSGTFVVYPYDDNSKVIPETILKASYPNTYRYLESQRQLLSGRLYFDKSTKLWFEIWNQRNKENFGLLRIVTPEISDRNHFAITDKYFGNTKTYHIIPKDKSLGHYFYLTALLNSCVLEFYFQAITTPQAGGFFAYKTQFLERLPIKPPSSPEVNLFSKLVPLIQFAKANAGANPGAAAFLEDLIDACVMECYFREHMAERDLLFHDTVAPHLAAYDPSASATQQRHFLAQFYATLNASKHPIRNRLLRITSDSPNLLAIIKREAKV
jgi:adenine-specific DNA-methyltransferase